MDNKEKSNRNAKEIEKFTQVLRDGGVTSSIPPIFSYWSCKYLSPRLVEIFGDNRIDYIFANEIASNFKLKFAKSQADGNEFNILSLGSGDCRTEIEIAKILISYGCVFKFYCTDLNPEVVSFAKELSKVENTENSMKFLVLDLNKEFPNMKFDVVMANHSLHHFVELEFLFDRVLSCLREDGIFVVSDMIGRNGHMRWPEALVYVESFWNFLPAKKRYNQFARCIEHAYCNYDCTTDDTFEGIRAQDILPLIIDRFYFERFVAHGNIIDIFIDRIYGNNFSPNDDFDVKFIDLVESVNTHLINHGIVKPTAMFATLKKSPTTCSYSKWSPEFCLRKL